MMIAALIVQFINVYAILNHQKLPFFMIVIFWVAGLGLLIHLIEAILAFFYGLFYRKNSVKLGIYIFFTGTISLLELFGINPDFKN
ncbi:hypothetical protein [Gloeothece verrucosa]|nr:hypothetical protein [Gloeothece verrucosa]